MIALRVGAQRRIAQARAPFRERVLACAAAGRCGLAVLDIGAALSAADAAMARRLVALEWLRAGRGPAPAAAFEALSRGGHAPQPRVRSAEALPERR